MGRTGRIVALGAVVAVAGVLAWALRPRPIDVDLVTVRSGLFVETVENEGRTHMRLRHVVASPIFGTQSRIPFDVGDHVDRSTVLVTITTGTTPIDNPRVRRQLEERLGAAEAAKLRADAVVARAEARLAQARSDLARTTALAAKGTASEAKREQDELVANVAARDVDVARLEAHVAEHEIDLARAAVGLSEKSAGTEERLEIRSPIEGVVIKVFHDSEGPVSLGTVLMEVADPGKLEVIADMLTTDAVRVSPGTPARIERWGGPKTLDAVVRRIEPAGFTKVSALGVDEQRVNVVLDLTSPPEDWRSLGDAFRVDVAIELSRQEDALTVPLSALFREGEGWSLFVDEAGRAFKRRLDLVATAGRLASIRGDIQRGARVVDFPPPSLRDGQRIRLRDGD
jgi:HlyD family secretion protein